MRTIGILVPAIVMMLSAGLAYAGGGTAFTYQGRLLDAGGPANGLFDFEFELWDAEVAGIQIGSTQIHNAVPITDGLFTLQIDFGANVFNNTDRWLTMTVDTVLLSPRQPVTRVPYAIQTRGIFVDEDQDVGIGTTNPTNPLHVLLTIPGQAVRIESTDPTNNFTALGITHNGSAPSILAFNSGTGHAGEFRVFNPNSAAAVRGLNQGFGNAGLFEINNANNSAPAIHAETNGTNGTAVFGTTASSGDAARGVYGYATSPTGGTIGVHGRVESTLGKAVFAYSAATSGINYGVDAYVNSPAGTAVRGVSVDPEGYGGYFIGRGHFQKHTTIGRSEIQITSAELFGVHTTAETDFGGMYVSTQGTGGKPFYGYSAGWDVDAYHYYDGPSDKWHLVIGGTRLTVNGSDGFVGIGTTTPGFRLEVNGSAGKPGGGSWSNASDRRLKKNIEDLDGSLDQLMKLRGVTFEYKDPDAINELHGERMGMIAQEVEEVFPDWVTEGGHGYKTLTFRGFEALTVEALRELKDENTHLQSENENLRERLDALESLVGHLMSERKERLE